MDWELINGVTGIISAISAIAGIGYLAIDKNMARATRERIPRLNVIVAFAIISSGWALLCLSFLWIAEPFGYYPTDAEYKRFFGILLSLPSLIIFIGGFNFLKGISKSAN